jgi:hypothetical protein
MFTHELTEGFSERFFFVPNSPDYLKLLHTSYGRDGSLGGNSLLSALCTLRKTKEKLLSDHLGFRAWSQ